MIWFVNLTEFTANHDSYNFSYRIRKKTACNILYELLLIVPTIDRFVINNWNNSISSKSIMIYFSYWWQIYQWLEQWVYFSYWWQIYQWLEQWVIIHIRLLTTNRELLWNRKQPGICQLWKASNLLASYASTVEGTVMLNVMPVLCNLLVMHKTSTQTIYGQECLWPLVWAEECWDKRVLYLFQVLSCCQQLAVPTIPPSICYPNLWNFMIKYPVVY